MESEPPKQLSICEMYLSERASLEIYWPSHVLKSYDFVFWKFDAKNSGLNRRKKFKIEAHVIQSSRYNSAEIRIELWLFRAVFVPNTSKQNFNGNANFRFQSK